MKTSTASIILAFCSALSIHSSPLPGGANVAVARSEGELAAGSAAPIQGLDNGRDDDRVEIKAASVPEVAPQGANGQGYGGGGERGGSGYGGEGGPGGPGYGGPGYGGPGGPGGPGYGGPGYGEGGDRGGPGYGEGGHEGGHKGGYKARGY